jgi:hypothetical protein
MRLSVFLHTAWLGRQQTDPVTPEVRIDGEVFHS